MDGPDPTGAATALTAGEAARRLGVAVTTLRSWHRRYGLGPSGYRPGRHRRYTAADLGRLEVMRRLTAGGVPAAQAARQALGGGLPAGLPAGPATADAGPFTDGRRARGLARAAVRLDAAVLRRQLAEALTAHGVVPLWDRLIRPTYHLIEARQARGQQLVDAEHLFSGVVSAVLAGVPRPELPPARVLLSCTDEEQHALPLEALAAALAEAGVATRHLGARVPGPALARAVRRVGPAVVVMWSHTAATAHLAQLAAVAAGRPRPLLLLAAGPGWQGAAVPAGAESGPDGLGPARDRIVAVLDAAAAARP
ncbi:MAG TPA: MerR family transcriptional regulator [Pilimelia sp.]|nr:MerR family transcriptional regulator [Pilimelia sp.]